jgi:phenylalanyl-tRNA synthetase beta chain
VINYALTTPEKEASLKPQGESSSPGGSNAAYLVLQNPISSERVALRQTLLAGVLDNAAANLRHTDDVRLFELGFIYLPKPGQALPDEPRRLAILLTGKRRYEFWSDSAAGEASAIPDLDFFDLKGVLEAISADLHLGGVGFEPSKAPYLHPGKAAAWSAGGKRLGDFGELHPKIGEVFGLAGRTVLVSEIDVDALQAHAPERFNYTPVPRFPSALRDIAVVVDEKIAAATVATEIRAAGSGLLRQVRLFDLYRGESIPPGTKSLAYALSYQAEDHTLTDKEVDKTHKKIEDRLKHVLKASIRGKEA